jgi:Holliday junction resolvasome RuvABC endonuclease subunit
MILGLDISTSITGYTVIDDNGSVVECSFIDLKKIKDVYGKAALCQSVFAKLFAKFSIKKVYIEESLQMFSMGKSSAKTLATLTKFNGILSWIIFNDFLILPAHIPAITARKKAGIVLVKGIKAKECVMKHMLTNESWFTVQYTKTGKIKPYYYDMADSWVIARSAIK